jgi:uncharacterized protein YuzE
MEGIAMKDFKVFYDDEEDILYLAKKGEEQKIEEVYPGINLELDGKGKLLGIEIFNASNLLKDVIKSMEKKLMSTAA